MSICESCDSGHDGSFGVGRFCSRPCSNRRTHTEESRKSRSDKLKGRDVGNQRLPREQRLCKYDECDNTFEAKIKSTKAYCGIPCANKAKGKNKEFREKLSHSLKRAYKNGKPVYGGNTKWIPYKDIKVQGSYEFRMCNVLDVMKERNLIHEWLYTNDRISYINVDSKESTYLLDFKVYRNDGSFYYIEVKGYEKENDSLKWESARKQGFDLEVKFDEDIKQLEEQLNCGG